MRDIVTCTTLTQKYKIDKQMKKYLSLAKKAANKSVDSIKNDGFSKFFIRGTKFVYYRQFPEKKPVHARDILFINGSTLPHPERYRVQHQVEQLTANVDMLRRYRGFVFFRCPITPTVREFIKLAKESNKVCFFDIDDLVIDDRYTDQISYVRSMSKQDREHYDDGVHRMQETLRMCDYAITTTKRLAEELKNYTSEVFINPNVASDEMVRHSTAAIKHVSKDSSRIVMGYFSGSITHNEDFEIILPNIVKLLEKYNNLYLKIVGLLDLPDMLKPFAERIITIDFMDWKLMPNEIASCDINLAPLKQTIFNEAKSENKWTEAALVKVITVASNVGAFAEVITDGVDGVLANDDQWVEKISDLIDNEDKRLNIAATAHGTVLKDHLTTTTKHDLAGFILSKLARNIAFVLPSTDISGGINVVLKHADILNKNGWDVTLIDNINHVTLKNSLKQYNYRLALPGYNVLTAHKTETEMHFDTVVATLWSTLEYIKEYPNTRNRLYFVQNFETDFYSHGDGLPRFLANASYRDQTGVRYVTMSLWCQEWLRERFNKESRYTPNGIDLQYYPFHERHFEDGKKIKILVEGDSRSEYKNTDEAFRIVERLDPEKYEISYLSYRKEPKDWYRVDHFYNRIDPDKVGEVYASCDILIKTSLLESFSYPPLEMMATGGVSLVVPNDGNVEYLRDGVNCLFYKQGDISDGVAKLEQIVKNEVLRAKLVTGGRETADRYQWKNLEADVLGLYL
jgi:glycosyltransferase involved in cell wall biosynthesis